MKALLATLLFIIACNIQAQFLRVREVEVFAGANLTGHPFFSIYDHTPGLGGQAGALAHIGKLNSKFRIRTGLMATYQHTETHMMTFHSSPGGNTWLLRDAESSSYDLEIPILFSRSFSIFGNNRLCPALGVIPGWGLSTVNHWRWDVLNMDGTRETTFHTVRPRPDYQWLFNRLSFYAGLQWQHTYESGRTLIVEPNCRLDLRNETISVGLNVGLLLHRRMMKTPAG